jgi:hypothetical protein
LSSIHGRLTFGAVRPIPLLSLLLTFLTAGPGLHAGTVKLVKVLPHRLDRDGRHTLSPSLYERDAYQDHLRKHPELCSGLRFDVQWKAERGSALKLRVEMRGSQGRDTTKAVIESIAVKRGSFSEWAAVTLKDDEFKKLGELVAWRATLWAGDQVVAEQKSFLW